jgi:hypothetical protein
LKFKCTAASLSSFTSIFTVGYSDMTSSGKLTGLITRFDHSGNLGTDCDSIFDASVPITTITISLPATFTSAVYNTPIALILTVSNVLNQWTPLTL